MKLSVGIDIGGTNTAFGLVDESGRIVARGHIGTRNNSDFQDYVNQVSDGIRQLLGQKNGAEL